MLNLRLAVSLLVLLSATASAQSSRGVSSRERVTRPAPPLACCSTAAPLTASPSLGPSAPTGAPWTLADLRTLIPLPGDGNWSALAPMTRDLGEVSAALIDNRVYVVGRGHPQTLRYDPSTNTWIESLTWRPFRGHHHAVEVFDGKMYLIGGRQTNSEGKVQIYNPVTNGWSLGADLPWSGGSVSTALIDGKIYAAGGIVDNLFTTDRCAVYDPLLDTWTELAPMPAGRNHTAAATDGERFWIFGGRGPGSGDTDVVANGYDDVQVYDPVTNSWQTSASSGSRLRPLPQFRGGLGKAIYRQGEFWVMGGETLSGPGATPLKVYGHVDVYDPELGIWRSAAPMLTPRHGIHPVRMNDDSILVPGGGTQAGGSQSTVVERWTP
ncbi:MAG: hypothetical protein DHS20C15_03180 [Planctomycetota bacterium]|nr:MAG: hypothetical protein DHS20C15_03180 [Planctomycetota bacterium]